MTQDKKKKSQYIAKNESNKNELQDSISMQSDYDASFALDDDFEMRVHLEEYSHADTRNFISTTQVSIICGVLFFVIAGIILMPHLVIPMFFVASSMLHFFLTLTKCQLFAWRTYNLDSKNQYIEQNFKNHVKDITVLSEDLPLYSILLPVFMEEKLVLTQLLDSIYNIDYPIKNMQVLLICEEVDKSTINHIRNIQSSLNYEMIIVPDFSPRTKAKACNYALKFVKGDYVVIFDADDIPAQDQLRVALKKFEENKDSNLACVQAKLNYYNANENLLTQLFSLEYAILFDKILPALSAHNYPLPLGGTSNHFKTKILKQLCGWDIYNLAEDAEIGMRLAINGYKTDVIDSYTAEESPITILAWIKQRSRWLKGFIQTYLLYLQKTHNLTNKIGFNKSLKSLHFMLGLSTLGMLMTPIILGLGIVMILSDVSISSNFNKNFITLTAISGATWVISNIYQATKIMKSSIFLKDLSRYQKIVTTIAFSPYYILHTVSALYAVFDLIRRPFYWSKTKHGVGKKKISIRKLLSMD